MRSSALVLLCLAPTLAHAHEWAVSASPFDFEAVVSPSRPRGLGRWTSLLSGRRADEPQTALINARRQPHNFTQRLLKWGIAHLRIGGAIRSTMRARYGHVHPILEQLALQSRTLDQGLNTTTFRLKY